MRIIVIGDSHTHAIKRALKTRHGLHPAHVEIEAYRYSRIKNGKTIGDLSAEQVIECVAELGSDDLVVSTIGGNQHQTLSLVQHPVPFSMFLPEESVPSESDPDCIIPYAQLWDVFERGLRGKDGIRLQQLREAARCRVIHLVPPPPKADAVHILKRHETDFAKAGILDKGISPASLRLKMWQLQTNVMKKLTGEWGVELLLPPLQALDAQGFLAPVYYAEDATHANTDYGALQVAQIVACC